MSTLLVELVGAQQAWGSRSRFAMRATELSPTRSGVIGLLAAALGLERTASLEQFGGLGFGVRIDQPGRVERDFQTTRSIDGSTSFPLSQRYYLADAAFLVGLEGSEQELHSYRDALARPHYPLFLGRRAFPPSGPLRTHLVDESLERALETHPWIARPHHQRSIRHERVTLEIVRDARPGERAIDTRQDVPESFDPRRRRHGSREVVIDSVTIAHPNVPAPPAPERHSPTAAHRHGDPLLGSPTDHDPSTLLADEEV